MYRKPYKKLYEAWNAGTGKIAVVYNTYDNAYQLMPGEFCNTDEYTDSNYTIYWCNTIKETQEILDMLPTPNHRQKLKHHYYVIYDPYHDEYTLQTLEGLQYLGIDDVIIAFSSNNIQKCIQYITK